MTSKLSLNGQNELSDLQEGLTEHLTGVVESVSKGRTKNCTDEIMSFCLLHVCKISRMWSLGQPGKRHFFVRSTSVTRELKRFNGEYREQLARCEDRFDLAQQVFRFSDQFEESPLFALQTQLQGKPLGDCYIIDSLYVPIYADSHFSLMIISVPRQRVIHLDSIGYSTHQEVVQNIISMFLAARILKSSQFAVRLAKTRVQKEDWECGWCALLFARWWRNAPLDADIDDAVKMPLTQENIQNLCLEILQENSKAAEIYNYAQRLENHYGALLEFAKPSQKSVNETTDNVSVSHADNSSSAHVIN